MWEYSPVFIVAECDRRALHRHIRSYAHDGAMEPNTSDCFEDGEQGPPVAQILSGGSFVAVAINRMHVFAEAFEITAVNDIWSRIAFAVSFSEEGAAEIERVGFDVPSLDGTLGTLPLTIAHGLSAALERAETRIARQLREISDLRQIAERTLEDFGRLETFALGTGNAERSTTHHLSPQPGLTLHLNGVAEQRLPGSSSGLSDVAVWIEAGTGCLTATLTLLESAETVAEWHVEAPKLGWLRLALPRALGSDPQTAILRIRAEAVTLGCAFDYPDARFQCLGGAVLALRLWGFIPGAAAPLSPEGHAPVGSVRRWLLGPLALAELAPDLVAEGGLILRPEPEQSLILRLPGMARPGMRHVTAWVEGVAEAGLALADAAPLWQSLTEPGQLHLPLPELNGPQDLSLHVRATLRLDRIEAFAHAMGRDD